MFGFSSTSNVTNLPHVQSNGLVVLVLCVLVVLNIPLTEGLRVPALLLLLLLLQQGHHNLSSVTHFQPKFGVAAVAAAVPAATSRVSSGPPARQLVTVCQ